MSFQLLILGLRQFAFWRQRQVVSTVALLIVAVIIAGVDSVRGRWQILTQQHLDASGFRLMTVTARGAHGFTTESAAQFRSEMPNCRVYQRLQNLMYVRTESGDWRPTLCGTFVTDDPQLKGLPATYGSLPADDGRPTAVVSKKLLQRFGFNLQEGQSHQNLEIALTLPEEGGRGERFQIVMLVDELEQPALRLPESTMIHWLKSNAPSPRAKEDIRVALKPADGNAASSAELRIAHRADPAQTLHAEKTSRFSSAANPFDTVTHENDEQRIPEFLSPADLGKDKTQRAAFPLNPPAAPRNEHGSVEGTFPTEKKNSPLEVAQIIIEVKDPRDIPKLASSLQAAGHRVESTYFQNSRQRALLEAVISVGGTLVAILLCLAVWAYSSQVFRALQNEAPRLALMRMTGANTETIVSYIVAPAIFNALFAMTLGLIAANEVFCGEAATQMNKALEAEIFGPIQSGFVGVVVLITAICCHLIPLIRVVARPDIDPDANAVI